MIPSQMTDEDLPPDSDNAAFKKAIDNIFKKVARRGKDHAEDAALRAREARKRADDIKDRQERRKRDR
jgi:hypothetical protein